MKEFFRKKIVGLKRSPQLICLIFVLLVCILYTCSLQSFSKATTSLYDQEYEAFLIDNEGFAGVSPIYRSPALIVFVNTLLSILLPITFMSVFKKGKANKFMFSIFVAMTVIMIIMDIVFIGALNFYMSDIWMASEPDMDVFVAQNKSITNSIVHIVFLALTLATLFLKPVFSKLLNKINTDVEDEYDKLIEQKSEEEMLMEVDDEN